MFEIDASYPWCKNGKGQAHKIKSRKISEFFEEKIGDERSKYCADGDHGEYEADVSVNVVKQRSKLVDDPIKANSDGSICSYRIFSPAHYTH